MEIWNKIKNFFKQKKELSSFQEDIQRDWGNPDICGPWTKPEDFYKDDGSLKMFKSYYLVNSGDLCNLNLDTFEGETEFKRRARRNKIKKVFNI